MAAESPELRIGRLEGKIDHLATKEDVAQLEASLLNKITESNRWQAGLLVAVAALAVGAIKLL